MVNKPKHIQQVDYIRAIASCGVALFHLGGKTLPLLNYGWLGVQMFFLLSGFIICWAMPDNYSWGMMGKFIAKRIIRIEPAYTVSIVLVLIVHYCWKPSSIIDWSNVFTHLAYINNFTGKPYFNPVYWTLGIEFQYYIFIAILFPLIIKKWGIWFLLILCIIPLIFPIPALNLLNVFSFFVLGILYYLFVKGIKSLNEVLVLGFIVTIISIYSAGWLQTCAGLFALGILLLPLKSVSVVSFLSKISFSLYLTHDIIGSNLVVFLGTHLPKTMPFKALEFSTGIVVSIMFAYVFYRFIEAPCLRLSKQIKYMSH